MKKYDSMLILKMLRRNSLLPLRRNRSVAQKTNSTEDYGVTPPQMKDIKALMGDSSDNIPGVAGVGKKTAEELIVKYGSIDYIYENLDTLDIRDTLREKLRNDKEKAYLSYKLGTIDTDSPIETDLNAYKKQPADAQKAVKMLTSLEMFKIMEKLNLSAQQSFSSAESSSEKSKTLEIKNGDIG